MIQEIAPKVFHNEYTSKMPEKNDRIILICQNKILVKETEDGIRLPQIQELPLMSGWQAQPYVYLFCIDKEQYFLFPEAVLSEAGADKERMFLWMKLPDVRDQAESEVCFVIYTAYHLYNWYRGHQFCGRCAGRMKPDQKERMLFCENCGSQVYPVISPAIIVAVTNGDKILLTKYARRQYQRYALIAGYTEIGETAEETVRREVMEEVGLRVKNIRYYKSQPWGIDGNLLLGYFAQLDGDADIRLDKNELAEAEWVSRSQLKDMDDSVSLTREMMRVFYEGNME